jgi:hypothetical protein
LTLNAEFCFVVVECFHMEQAEGTKQGVVKALDLRLEALGWRTGQAGRLRYGQRPITRSQALTFDF